MCTLLWLQVSINLCVSLQTCSVTFIPDYIPPRSIHTSAPVSSSLLLRHQFKSGSFPHWQFLRFRSYSCLTLLQLDSTQWYQNLFWEYQTSSLHQSWLKYKTNGLIVVLWRDILWAYMINLIVTWMATLCILLLLLLHMKTAVRVLEQFERDLNDHTLVVVPCTLQACKYTCTDPEYLAPAIKDWKAKGWSARMWFHLHLRERRSLQPTKLTILMIVTCNDLAVQNVNLMNTQLVIN